LAEWYSLHRSLPANRRDINLDSMNILGPHLTLCPRCGTLFTESRVEAIAKERRVRIAGPPPEQGSFFRSDHFRLQSQIPSISLKEGNDYVSHQS
jgi:hypothetical protein